MAIPEIPVWSIKHNWAQPIMERLEWLTDVLASQSGAEQRRALRLSPRRYFEFTVNPTKGERTFVDLMIRKLFANQWLVPLWHDKGKLSAAAVLGANRLVFDNRWREFVTGGYALVFKDAWTYEVVEIEGQDDDGLDLAEVTSAAWPKGAAVFPLRIGLMSEQSNTLEAITGTVGEAVVGFTIPAMNDFDPGDETLPLYAGRPVLNIPPNRAESISAQIERITADRDSMTGLIYRGDEAGRSFANQSYSWQVHGREAQYAFRALLYRLQGRQNAIWLPTYNDDLVLAKPALDDATMLSVGQAGLAYVGAPFAGREHIWIGGNQGRKVNALAAPLVDGEERILLNAGVDGPLSVGTSISWLDVGRLDQDVVEITHHTDSEGTLECAAVLKSFADTRNPAGTIYLPVPAAVENFDQCGEPEDVNPCVDHSCPPTTIYAWDLQFNGCNGGYCPTRNWYPPTFYNDPDYPNIINPPVAPGGPSGKSLGSMLSVFNNCNNSGEIYEFDYYNDPESGWYLNPLAIKLQGQLLFEWFTTNGSFGCTYHGAVVSGAGQLQIQYGAFWCGDHIAIGNLTRTIAAPPDCVATPEPLLVNVELVGNVPYTWTW